MHSAVDLNGIVVIQLFERGMRSEAAAEIGGDIYDRFEVSGPKKKTVDRVRHFGGRVPASA